MTNKLVFVFPLYISKKCD